MRIITGLAKGTKIETLDGEEIIRPTGGKVKEAIFTMIQFDIEGRRVLDLFAGSGQLGLEALSRGAASAVFIDANPKVTDLIKRNAQKVKLYPKCVVLTTDYKAYLRNIMNKDKFDIIFLDPPYASEMIYEALSVIIEGDLIAPNGIIICETNDPSPISGGNLVLHRHKKYGRTYVSVLLNTDYTAETDDEQV
jgi:16S rRNA (guanine(966)-N(2))-methyltransferase RsmD